MDIRKQAREYLAEKVESAFDRCHWCKCEIIWRWRVAGRIKTDHKNHTVSYRIGDEIFTTPMATVDHVIPISEGGGNSLLNLVSSCYDCNAERNYQAQLRENEQNKVSFNSAPFIPAHKIKKLRIK